MSEVLSRYALDIEMYHRINKENKETTMPLRNIVRQIMERHARANFADTDEVILRLEQEIRELKAENLKWKKPKYKMGGCIKDWQQETEI